MTDITEEAATEVGEESKAEEASVKKERNQLYFFLLLLTVIFVRAFLFDMSFILGWEGKGKEQ